MVSRLKVDNFYRKKHEWCVEAVMKGKRGDRVTIHHDDAVDIVHDTFISWLSKPESFNEEYAWNRLMSRRKDWMRNESRRRETEEKFRLHYGEQLRREESADPACISMRGDIKMKIRGAILTKKLDHHVEILYAHFVDGFTIPEIEVGNRRMREDVVRRFRYMMVKKYGGD